MSGQGGGGKGRTRRGRLEALDRYVLTVETELLSRRDGPWAEAPFVDVGFGDEPWTTLEAAAALRSVQPQLAVVGVDRDATRVERAQAHADERTRFVCAPLEDLVRRAPPARIVRAMNVLRGFSFEDARAAHERLALAVLPGGLVIEGSTDTDGAVLTAHLLRRDADVLRREALLFHTDFTRGFAPLLFRDWLPRDLRRSVRPGTAIHGFFSRWTDAWARARERGVSSPREAFRASIRALIAEGEPLRADGWLLENGFACWAPSSGVPLASPR